MAFLSSPEVLLLLFVLAILAGFFDALAGGGGLIVVPSLLLLGLSPIQAIATNKLQASFGTFTAATILLRKKVVQLDFIRIACLMVFLGAVVGSVAIQWLPQEGLQIFIPIVLTVIAVYFLFYSSNEKEKKSCVRPAIYNIFVAPIVGFYDGAVGPGAGSFYAFTNVVFLGKKLVTATANAKVLNFSSNMAALLVFTFSDQIVWVVGFLMAAGTAIGATMGSKVVITKGIKVIRPLTVIICMAMLISYIVTVV